jgi:hypothetical protein
MVAKVGKEIDGFRERAGFVLAIIETTTVVQVVTVRRTIDNPIMVGLNDVLWRVHFEQ